MNIPATAEKTNWTFSPQDTSQVFRPRLSQGWVWLIIIGLLALASLTLSVQMAAQALTVPLILTLGIQATVCLCAFALAFWFPTMRYELDCDSLTLRYGPILTYRIPFDEIQTIRRCDLGLTLWSSIRFPGIALFTIPTGDAGNVKMCATAAMKGILLIETPRAKYGITPADETEFVRAIRARIKE
jgi:hypothetical protein